MSRKGQQNAELVSSVCVRRKGPQGTTDNRIENIIEFSDIYKSVICKSNDIWSPTKGTGIWQWQ